MYTIAFALEIFTLLCALGGAFLACYVLFVEKNTLETNFLPLIEKASFGLTAGHVIASILLLFALINFDFQVNYVADYTDLTLPLFYRMTAFWAGQPGSLLFWALMIALCGAAFQCTSAYKNLAPETKQWYWVFYFAIMAFFALLLTTWSNPFTMTNPAPVDGRGLNPLLQHPGMIIHPPLLFLGYGGFTIPSCLALAQLLSNKKSDESWLVISRPFIMTAWLFLSAGIILGAWWAYMELGWGGYWAWDPVENASLIPWLVGTAALHTMIIEQRRNKLQRVNTFLIALTTVSAFFATYLVRGNVVKSVHAFGDGGVGTALLIFVVASLLLIFFVAATAPKREKAEALAGIETKEGFLIFTAILLITLSIVILLGTIWPLISAFWSEQPKGLDASFYNRVCLPLFVMLAGVLMLCPYLSWKGGFKEKINVAIILGTGALCIGISYAYGYTQPLALMATGISVSVLVSGFIQLLKPSTFAFLPRLAAHGVHIGFALIALGVTFSSAYKIEKDFTLGVGESAQIGGYTVVVNEIYEGSAPTFDFLEAEVLVYKGDKIKGIISPQRRIYTKFGRQGFSEAGTQFSLGDEIYASLYGSDGVKAVLHININPLVNWIWVGSLLLCLFPFLSLNAVKRREED